MHTNPSDFVVGVNSITVVIDTAPPTVLITTPNGQPRLGSLPTLVGVSADNQVVDHVQVRIRINPAGILATTGTRRRRTRSIWAPRTSRRGSLRPVH